jgi:hypothetical protein
MNILNNVPVIYLTEEQIQRIKLDQRARRLEPNLSNAEAEEMWHLLHEEPEYADEILDGYEKLIRDRRIQWVIDHLPEKEGYMMENAIYAMPEYADEILDYWEDLAKNCKFFVDKDGSTTRLHRREWYDDNNRDDDDDGWGDVGWDDDND